MTMVRKSSVRKSKGASPPRPVEAVPKRISAHSKSGPSPVLPFEGRLPNSHASAFLPSFGPFSFSITVDAVLAKGQVSDLRFTTNGPPAFKRLVAESCPLFIGKNEDAVEFFTFDVFLEQISPSQEERGYALYAWTAIQDACGRLPFSDPLSSAIGKLRFLNREFEHGTLMPDLED